MEDRKDDGSCDSNFHIGQSDRPLMVSKEDTAVVSVIDNVPAVLREHIAFLREMLADKKHVLEILLEDSRKLANMLTEENVLLRDRLRQVQVALAGACAEIRNCDETSSVPCIKHTVEWEKLLT